MSASQTCGVLLSNWIIIKIISTSFLSCSERHNCHYYLALVTALPICTLRAFCQTAGGGITAWVLTFLNMIRTFFKRNCNGINSLSYNIIAYMITFYLQDSTVTFLACFHNGITTYWTPKHIMLIWNIQQAADIIVL